MSLSKSTKDDDIWDQFLLGSATSSHQVEGGNRWNDWWKWEEEGRIEGGVRSGSACDHWNRFEEDLRLAASLNHNTYRLSIEWSRVEPEQGVFSDGAIEHYGKIIEACKQNGLVPMVTLHHFTLPQWLSERGGWCWSGAAQAFETYTRKIAEAWGKEVLLWCTINEPVVMIVGGYLGKFMPPAIESADQGAIALGNLLDAHQKCYKTLHKILGSRIEVGFAHNMIDFYPDRKWHPMDQVLCYFTRRFYNMAWLEAMTGKKVKFQIPGLFPPVPSPLTVGEVVTDFVGINYYTKCYLQWKPRDSAQDANPAFPVGAAFGRRNEVVSDVGWAIYPKGLKRLIRDVARYQLPIYITENGIADRSDVHRRKYVEDHLAIVKSAKERGIDIRGYYYWSLLDNFEWIKGYGPRFGLIHVDYKTQKRTLTGSADQLRALFGKITSRSPKPLDLPSSGARSPKAADVFELFAGSGEA